MAVDVMAYRPVLTYTDEPVEEVAAPDPGVEVWLWKIRVRKYLAIENARRNRMLLAVDGQGRRLYALSESGHLKRTHPLSKSRRARVIARDGACVWCGSTDSLEVDHIIRYIDGGTNEMTNLRTLCHSCHGSRGGGA